MRPHLERTNRGKRMARNTNISPKRVNASTQRSKGIWPRRKKQDKTSPTHRRTHHGNLDIFIDPQRSRPPGSTSTLNRPTPAWLVSGEQFARSHRGSQLKSLLVSPTPPGTSAPRRHPAKSPARAWHGNVWAFGLATDPFEMLNFQISTLSTLLPLHHAPSGSGCGCHPLST